MLISKTQEVVIGLLMEAEQVLVVGRERRERHVCRPQFLAIDPACRAARKLFGRVVASQPETQQWPLDRFEIQERLVAGDRASSITSSYPLDHSRRSRAAGLPIT